MGIGGQGDGQPGDALHLLLQEGLDTGGLLCRALHDEFIVDLHDEPGGQTLAGEPLLYPDHGQFHDVRRRPLNGHIQRHPLPEGAEVEVGALQLRQRPTPPEEGDDVALLPGLLHTSVIYRRTPVYVAK